MFQEILNWVNLKLLNHLLWQEGWHLLAIPTCTCIHLRQIIDFIYMYAYILNTSIHVFGYLHLSWYSVDKMSKRKYGKNTLKYTSWWWIWLPISIILVLSIFRSWIQYYSYIFDSNADDKRSLLETYIISKFGISGTYD